jgi:methylenetetrahydrofolate reductase (NADH) small subunit
MIVTERKPIEELTPMFAGEKGTYIVACGGCPVGHKSGDEASLVQLEADLKAQGVNVLGRTSIDFLCNKTLVALRLMRVLNEVEAADSLLIVSCGIGVQATGATIDKPVHPAMNTVSMGGFQGLWPAHERCGECGDCNLDLTGGICPVIFCSKSLLNGSCGGSDKGKCEVHKDIPCGWTLIYERLKKTGRLDKLSTLNILKNRDLMRVPPERRVGMDWALELEPPAPQPEEAKKG